MEILLYGGILSPVIPLVSFLIFKRKEKGRTLRVVLLYILYCIANECMSFYLQNIVRSSDILYLFLLFTIVEYSFFCYFIHAALPPGLVKKSIIFIWISFLLVAFIDYFLVNNGQEWDSLPSGIESIIIILLCIYYLFTQIKGSISLLIYSTFNFWVVITFLFYFSGTFFLYIMTESMRENADFQKQYFIINIVFNILKNILLAIAMTMRLNNNKEKEVQSPVFNDEIFFKTKDN